MSRKTNLTVYTTVLRPTVLYKYETFDFQLKEMRENIVNLREVTNIEVILEECDLLITQ